MNSLSQFPPHFYLFAVGAVIVGIVVVIKMVTEVFKTRAREQTKREIAAYVAEGSITPEDAAKLMSKPSSDFEKKVADAVAWGTIKPEKAAELIRAIRDELKTERTG